MSREVYTYANLARIYENISFQQIIKYPIITVSQDLKEGLKNLVQTDYSGKKTGTKVNIYAIDFYHLSRRIDHNWSSDRSKFKASIILSSYLRNRIRETSLLSEKNWLIGCVRNIDNVIAAVILLEEADVNPEDIDYCGSRDLQMFVNCWQLLREKWLDIGLYKSRLAALQTVSDWNGLFGYDSKKQDSESIVFMGFYYITPYQQKIINLLEKAGYNLIFLIPYNSKSPYIYQISEETYCESNGFPSVQKWHIDTHESSSPGVQLFEGNDHCICDNVSVYRYSTIIEFVGDIKRIKEENYRLYSANPKLVNQILKDYYPEEYGERNLLSYPIGQFIHTLNQIWDEELQTITFEQGDIIECFASGWLSCDGNNGKNYWDDLFKVLPYFQDCHTVEQWKERAEYLHEIHESVISIFGSNADTRDHVGRWQEAIGNPLLSFGSFSVEQSKLNIITRLIYKLFDMASVLFNDEGETSISTHFNKLNLVLSRAELTDDIYAEERKIVDEILNRLKAGDNESIKCFPADFVRGLELFITGRFDEGEIQVKQKELVAPLYTVEASSLINNKIHLCLCDVNNMPGGNKEYVWPLTTKVIENCYSKTGNKLLLNMKHVMESTAACNRYFFFSTLENQNVCISWIALMDDKLLAPSPYIKFLQTICDVRVLWRGGEQINIKSVESIPLGFNKLDRYKNEKMPIDTVKEAKMDYALCPMRYTLGYILEKYPVFQSEFQQNYAINSLIDALSGLLDEDTSIVYDNVIALFPGLRKIEKRQVYDYISRGDDLEELNYKDFSECGSKFYSNERFKIHYPNKGDRDAALNLYAKLATPDGRRGMNLYENMSKTDICSMCPHIDYCRNARYAIDWNSDQDENYD